MFNKKYYVILLFILKVKILYAGVYSESFERDYFKHVNDGRSLLYLLNDQDYTDGLIRKFTENLAFQVSGYRSSYEEIFSPYRQQKLHSF